MTVEARYTFSKWFGLRRESRTEVADFRTITERVTPYKTTVNRPHLEILREATDPKTEDYTFARAMSEDQIETYDWNPIDNEERNRKVYTGQEINDEALQNEDGTIVYSWRETQPGDYPQLTPGQEVEPIQLEFRLTGNIDDKRSLNPLSEPVLNQNS
jgi:hypothetical protein